MSFSPQRMGEFSVRKQKAMLTVRNALLEFEALDAIYTHEAASGSNPDFVDTDDITKQEFIDGVVFGRDLATLIRGGAVLANVDRTSQLTPFIQGPVAAVIPS